jgi:hypothetical protein
MTRPVRASASVCVLLLLGSATVACAGETTGVPSPGATASPSIPRDLTITESSADHDSGTFAHAPSTITFDARTVTPAQSEFTLSVNGKRFSASKDSDKGTGRWSGGGAVLQAGDRIALKEFGAALNATWNPSASSPERKIPAHRDLTLRMVALLTDAPLGVAIGDQVAPGPGK